MTSEAQILEVVQASNRAEELAGQFYQLCQRILNDGMAVHRGTPACDMAMEIMDEQNKLFYIVYPVWARYPTIEVFQEDNPPSRFERGKATLLKRYTAFQQIQSAMIRMDKACWRVRNRWNWLLERKGELT